jgi:quercetin dioxygenase-like cupin family protein
MIEYFGSIEELTEENTDFRRVLYSGSKLQLVLMAVEPGQKLGGEIHANVDQFFRIEDGEGRLIIDGMTHKVKAGDGIVVPAGAHHNLICIGHDALPKTYFAFHSHPLVYSSRFIILSLSVLRLTHFKILS